MIHADLKNRRALVTGGASGIGLACVTMLAQSGAKVALNYLEDDPAGPAKVAELQAQGLDVIGAPGNVSIPGNAEAMVKYAIADLGGLDFLVNNAGATWGAPFDTYPDDGFDKIMFLNVHSVFSLTRNLAKALEAAGSPDDPARVINIGSMDGLHVPTVSETGTFAYSASKAAVHHLTRALAIELAPRHITVNAIAPGFFESKMTDYVLGNFKDKIGRASCRERV